MPNPEIVLFEDLMNRRYKLLRYLPTGDGEFSTSAGALSHRLDKLVTYTAASFGSGLSTLFLYYTSLASIEKDCRKSEAVELTTR